MPKRHRMARPKGYPFPMPKQRECMESERISYPQPDIGQLRKQARTIKGRTNMQREAAHDSAEEARHISEGKHRIINSTNCFTE